MKANDKHTTIEGKFWLPAVRIKENEIFINFYNYSFFVASCWLAGDVKFCDNTSFFLPEIIAVMSYLPTETKFNLKKIF